MGSLGSREGGGGYLVPQSTEGRKVRGAVGPDWTEKVVRPELLCGTDRSSLPARLNGLSKGEECKSLQALIDFLAILVEWEQVGKLEK
jgi:hypothetical protein